ncbi:MAG: hypothetical protein U1E65_30660 [Myxococcota bacterium]
MNDELIEEVAGAFRPRRASGDTTLPAWHDLDAAGRERAFALAVGLRKLEAALDPEGLSTTARAVLSKIRGR